MSQKVVLCGVSAQLAMARLIGTWLCSALAVARSCVAECIFERI